MPFSWGATNALHSTGKFQCPRVQYAAQAAACSLHTQRPFQKFHCNSPVGRIALRQPPREAFEHCFKIHRAGMMSRLLSLDIIDGPWMFEWMNVLMINVWVCIHCFCGGEWVESLKPLMLVVDWSLSLMRPLPNNNNAAPIQYFLSNQGILFFFPSVSLLFQCLTISVCWQLLKQEGWIKWTSQSHWFNLNFQVKFININSSSFSLSLLFFKKPFSTELQVLHHHHFLFLGVFIQAIIKQQLSAERGNREETQEDHWVCVCVIVNSFVPLHLHFFSQEPKVSLCNVMCLSCCCSHDDESTIQGTWLVNPSIQKTFLPLRMRVSSFFHKPPSRNTISTLEWRVKRFVIKRDKR